MSKRRLTPDIVIALRQERKRGMAMTDMAKMCEVNVQTVCAAALGRTWSHLNGIEAPVPAYLHNRVLRKLSDEEVKEMRTQRGGGATYTELSQAFGVSRSMVHRIINQVHYKHIL